jgi:hypothetical protein
MSDDVNYYDQAKKMEEEEWSRNYKDLIIEESIRSTAENNDENANHEDMDATTDYLSGNDVDEEDRDSIAEEYLSQK